MHYSNFKCIFLWDHAVDVCANLYWANSFEGGSTYLIIVLQYRKQWMINIVDILLLFGWEEYHIFFLAFPLKKSRHIFGVSQYPESTSRRGIYTGHCMYVWKNQYVSKNNKFFECLHNFEAVPSSILPTCVCLSSAWIKMMINWKRLFRKLALLNKNRVNLG